MPVSIAKPAVHRPCCRHLRTGPRRASTMIFVIVALPVLIAFASLAVDFGRVNLLRGELRAAADAAARYGVRSLDAGTAAARRAAYAAANENLANGTAVVLTAADIEVGAWNDTTRTFQPLADTATGINAIRVTARRTKARGTAVELSFASTIGLSSFDVKATSIARYFPAEEIESTVNACANPWLAGEPDGTLDNTNLYNASVRRDRAGTYTDPAGVVHVNGESPTQLTAVELKAGEALSFDAIAGTGAHGSGQTVVGPDGNPAKISQPWAGAHFGKSSIRAPIDSVLGVFLTDAAPTSATPPDALDFSTEAQRDFLSLSPQIGQVFFIGDGLTSGGVKQTFQVPVGATRLFIAKMDGTEWNNNVGSSTVTTFRPARTLIVK